MDYDVAVIGAGIHGAGVAQAAAAAGYRVLVLEQYSLPALGTSSRSSKLIHGGLRYLESGQFRLVWECLQERARLLKNAPHLVRLAPFLIPVYRETQRRPWKIAVGLSIYSLFSRLPFSWVSRHRWKDLDGLRREGLQTVFSYYDAVTDDARLTRAVLASAVSLGAELRLSACFVGATLNAGGADLRFRTAEGHHRITSRVIVNTAGPWVNAVLSKITPSQSLYPMELVQGTHIQLPGRVSGIYYVEAPQDRRAVFVIPWRDTILVGTTETPYEGDPADVHPLAAEIDYLLGVYNYYFTCQRSRQKIQDAFAGLRVLPAGEEGAFFRSRETVLKENCVSRPRLVTLYGGKLTAYRATATKVMKKIARSLPPRQPMADTRNLPLPLVD